MEFNLKIDWKEVTLDRGSVELQMLPVQWKEEVNRRREQDRKVTISQQMAQRVNKDQVEVELPTHYLKYQELFSEKLASHFPPDQPENY